MAKCKYCLSENSSIIIVPDKKNKSLKVNMIKCNNCNHKALDKNQVEF